MNCDRCGLAIGQDDKVADVEIDLSRTERYDLIWCEGCTKEVIEE